MNALHLTLFVSAVLFAYGLVQFTGSWLRKDHEHSDRLALLPLADDDFCPAAGTAKNPSPTVSVPAGEQP